jgi:quinol monooxygenase YgiN
MPFIQIIEITTTRIDAVYELVNQWVAQTEATRTALRATLTEDRDRPGTYLQMVEFASHAAAMVNSELPATAAFAKALAELCEAPPLFRNAEVCKVFHLT